MPNSRRQHPPGKRFPHCPNPDCPFHRPQPEWRYIKGGFFRRVSDGRSFRRYACCCCHRTFTVRTFSSDYWLRYRDLFPEIVQQSVNAAGLRQIGRVFGISHSTAGRHLARAGRHCLVFQTRELKDRFPEEPLVIDGLETFEHSQYFPFHLNEAVGSKSWFIYGFTDSPLRRKGRMTPEQHQRREELEAALGCPDPKAVEKGILQLLRSVWIPRTAPVQVCLHSDEHPAYERALGTFRKERPEITIEHQQTSSKKRRTTSNPLFPVNLVDLLLRHSGANHRRETIAFSKRRQGACERGAVFMVWRNWVKRRREKEAGKTTAMEAGLAARQLQWSDVLRRRLFVTHHELSESWTEYYWGRVKTAALGERQRSHQLKYAY
jgi:transposase-like protein